MDFFKSCIDNAIIILEQFYVQDKYSIRVDLTPESLDCETWEDLASKIKNIDSILNELKKNEKNTAGLKSLIEGLLFEANHKVITNAILKNSNYEINNEPIFLSINGWSANAKLNEPYNYRKYACEMLDENKKIVKYLKIIIN